MHKPTDKEIKTVERYVRMIGRRNDNRSVLAAAEGSGWLYALRNYGGVRLSFRDCRRTVY